MESGGGEGGGGGAGGAGGGGQSSVASGRLNVSGRGGGGNLYISGEMEETLKRIQESKNVVGLVVVNGEGLPVTSSLDSTLTVQYSDLITNLVTTARSVVRALDPANTLEYFRVRSKKHEILIAPDQEYTLFIIQSPQDNNANAGTDPRVLQ